MATPDITVAIADDHDVYRDGLALLLSSLPGVTIAGEAANGKSLLQLLKLKKPDVALVDLGMPVVGGIEAIAEVKRLQLPVRCIALTNFDGDGYVVKALEAGALGYIRKNSHKSEILAAVRAVYSGHPYYCPSTSAQLAKLIGRSHFDPYRGLPADLFSDREKQVIRLICEGKTTKEIGETLFLSPRTIDDTRAGILQKMGARTPAAIVVYAIKHNLYFLE